MSLPDILTLASAIHPLEKDSPFSGFRDKMLTFEKRLPRSFGTDATSERIPIGVGLAYAHYASGVSGKNGTSAGQTCAFRFLPSQRITLAVGVSAWSHSAKR